MRLEIETMLRFRDSSLVFFNGSGYQKKGDNPSLLHSIVENQPIKVENRSRVEVKIFYTLGRQTIDSFGKRSLIGDLLSEWSEKDNVDAYLLNYLQENSSVVSVFVWVDLNKNCIYLTRDTFGFVPIYVRFEPEDFLAFSTDIAYLRDTVDRGINEDTVVSYLFNRDSGKAYSGKTFFNGVFTLLPGTLNCFSPQSQTVRFYTKFCPEKWKNLKSIEEFGLGYRTYWSSLEWRS
jgi:hypothetical protein